MEMDTTRFDYNMTIQEAQILKDQVEAEITNLVENYMIQTGLVVTDIEYVTQVNFKITSLVRLELIVKL